MNFKVDIKCKNATNVRLQREEKLHFFLFENQCRNTGILQIPSYYLTLIPELNIITPSINVVSVHSCFSKRKFCVKS